MDIREMDRWLADNAAQAVDGHLARCARNPWTRGFLMCQPGHILIEGVLVPDFELVTGEQIPRNMVRQGLIAWCVERLRRAPCLPTEE